MSKLQGTIAAVLLFSGCATIAGSSRSDVPLPDDPVAKAAPTLNSCEKWTRSLHAHISNLSISGDGRRILVSTSAEHHGDARLRALDGNGRTLWSLELADPVKAQALSPDGSLAVVNTYDGKLTAYDGRTGRKRWEHDHLGRPVVFPKTRHVILLNDDDSEPKTAFASYDFNGKLVATVKADRESLEMDTPDDESYVAVTATDRSLQAYRSNGVLLWKGLLAGDPVSIRAQGGAAPRIFALTTDPKRKGGQSLTAFTPEGGDKGTFKTLWSVELDRKYEAVRAAGNSVFLYGNTHSGQALAAFAADLGTAVWRHSYSVPANFSSLAYGGDGERPYFSVAIDEGKPAGQLHLLGVGSQGAALWDTLIEATSGLYSYAIADKARVIVAGAGEPGDGLVEYVTLKSGACGVPKHFD